MRIKTKRHVLGEDSHCVNSRINTVAEREINNPVLTAKGNGRFCYIRSEYPETAALSSRQEHGDHFLFNHHLNFSSYLARLMQAMTE